MVLVSYFLFLITSYIFLFLISKIFIVWYGVILITWVLWVPFFLWIILTLTEFYGPFGFTLRRYRRFFLLSPDPISHPISILLPYFRYLSWFFSMNDLNTPFFSFISFGQMINEKSYICFLLFCRWIQFQIMQFSVFFVFFPSFIRWYFLAISDIFVN